MNSQEEHSACYRMQMERELTLSMTCVEPLNWQASEASLTLLVMSTEARDICIDMSVSSV